jgi:hypothetical protein
MLFVFVFHLRAFRNVARVGQHGQQAQSNEAQVEQLTNHVENSLIQQEFFSLLKQLECFIFFAFFEEFFTLFAHGFGLFNIGTSALGLEESDIHVFHFTRHGASAVRKGQGIHRQD